MVDRGSKIMPNISIRLKKHSPKQVWARVPRVGQSPKGKWARVWLQKQPICGYRPRAETGEPSSSNCWLLGRIGGMGQAQRNAGLGLAWKA
ncbi:hypothetical protein PS1_024188 [Malus domestica]